MTAQAHREKFKIELNTPFEKKLKTIIFEERHGLSLSMAGVFDIQFTAVTDEAVSFTGAPENESKVKAAFAQLAGQVAAGIYIDKNKIKEIAKGMNPVKRTAAPAFDAAANDNKGRPFSAKNVAQTQLSLLIDDNDLIFVTGPAGTGKTHIAVIKAVQAMKGGKIGKILIARPATESGEKIGFLPGTQEDKLAPYMRPIYDEFDKAFGSGKYKQMMEEGKLEVVPVGFMRGRTFSDAFVILDEAQNTTIEQIKMALTRIGENSKMVVTGDPAQIDLPNKADSGLLFAVRRLEGIEGVGVQRFTQGEVVRSKIVKAIVDALTVENPQKQEAPKPQR
jgi:phosphate starvation-inducible PhoH-like protein